MTKGVLDYELIDFGNGRKLERFGSVITERPEILAHNIQPALANEWKGTNIAKYSGEAHAPGRWMVPNSLPEEWTCAYQRGQTQWQVICSLGKHKHIGIFPEQAQHWDFLSEKCTTGMRVLNLFGYTGAASLCAAATGASVYHVDASHSILNRAAQNAGLSALDHIHWVCEDAMLFAGREVKRQRKYDLVLLDPPIFGRGRRGEIWKLEEMLPQMMLTVRNLLVGGGIAILNTYSPSLGIDEMTEIAQYSGLRHIDSGWLGVKDRTGRRLDLSKYLVSSL